jgi:ABC-type uncharacterized transport system ATPase subunit
MLELIDLARAYGGKVALDGLSFTVGPGQMFGFRRAKRRGQYDDDADRPWGARA